MSFFKKLKIFNLVYTILHHFFFLLFGLINFIYVLIFIILLKNLILINKFIKHN